MSVVALVVLDRHDHHIHPVKSAIARPVPDLVMPDIPPQIVSHIFLKGRVGMVTGVHDPVVLADQVP